MKMRSAAIVALGGLLLSACAGTPPPPPVLTVSAENCTAKADLALAQPLVLAAKPGDEKPQATIFDAQTPCFEPAPGAKSFYRIFALPPDAADYTIAVASSPFGSGVFAPNVTLLGADGASVREIPREKFIFRGNDLTTLFRNHPGERYLLISSDPATLGKTFERTQEQTQVYTASTGYATFQVHTGTDTTNMLIYSANGNVSVTLAVIPPPEKKS